MMEWKCKQRLAESIYIERGLERLTNRLIGRLRRETGHPICSYENYVYTHTYVHTHVHICVSIYLYFDRERERKRKRQIKGKTELEKKNSQKKYYPNNQENSTFLNNDISKREMKGRGTGT